MRGVSISEAAENKCVEKQYALIQTRGSITTLVSDLMRPNRYRHLVLSAFSSPYRHIAHARITLVGVTLSILRLSSANGP